MTVQAPYVQRADAGGYGPFIHQGAQVGEIRALSAGSDGALEVGVWRSGPATYDYFFADDEAFGVLEVPPVSSCRRRARPWRSPQVTRRLISRQRKWHWETAATQSMRDHYESYAGKQMVAEREIAEDLVKAREGFYSPPKAE